MNPQFTVETITPIRAEEYLAHNVKNRNKKPIKIGRYARDMRAGNWILTGEAVKFDTDGNLLDGQNRLYACIESGVAFQTVVIRDVAPSAQDVMDTGAARSGWDQLGLHGFSSAKNLQAAFNAHHAYHSRIIKRANDDVSGWSRLTNAELIDYAKRFPELQSAVECVARYGRLFRGFPIGALALAWNEFSAIDPDDTVEFFDRYARMNFEGRGMPLKALKRRLDNDHERQAARYKLGTAVYLLFRTWNAFRTGESLSKLQAGSDNRGWTPIPPLS